MNAQQNSVIFSVNQTVEELQGVYYRGRGMCNTDTERKEYDKRNSFFKEMADAMLRVQVKFGVTANKDKTGYELTKLDNIES